MHCTVLFTVFCSFDFLASEPFGCVFGRRHWQALISFYPLRCLPMDPSFSLIPLFLFGGKFHFDIFWGQFLAHCWPCFVFAGTKCKEALNPYRNATFCVDIVCIFVFCQTSRLHNLSQLLCNFSLSGQTANYYFYSQGPKMSCSIQSLPFWELVP